MSKTTIDLNEKTYGQLLSRTLPHVIRTEQELARLTNELMSLDARDDLAPEEQQLAELLTVLIHEYEERRYPIRKASPLQTLRHLMEARSLTQKDLWNLFGSKGITSEVLHGKRAISKAQAKKLAAFFQVTADLFFRARVKTEVIVFPKGAKEYLPLVELAGNKQKWFESIDTAVSGIRRLFIKD